MLDNIDEMQTKSGKRFSVYTLGCPEGDTECEDEQEEGVLATIDFRMTDDSLGFEEGSAIPTEAGNIFLEELAEPLSVHASMLLTVFQEDRIQRNESLQL